MNDQQFRTILGYLMSIDISLTVIMFCAVLLVVYATIQLFRGK